MTAYFQQTHKPFPMTAGECRLRTWQRTGRLVGILILSFFICRADLHAQHYLEIIDNDSTESNEERHDLIIDFLADLDFEYCADIGSGDMELILKIADTYFNKRFVLEDIDTSGFNRAHMNERISTLDLTRIDTGLLAVQIGDTTSTRLPSDHFDLVLMSGLIHEIDMKDAFFDEMKRILMPLGTMVISDAFYELPPGAHQGCRNRFMTHEELDELIAHQDLRILKEWRRTGIKTNSNGAYVSRIIQCSFN